MLALCPSTVPLPAPALAQTTDQTFNQQIVESPCEQATAAYPFTETGYPFKVSRLRRALAATEIEQPGDVGVAVFDNHFLGYHLEDSANDQPMQADRNFPKEFFVRRGERFTPYYDKDVTPPGAEQYESIDPQTGHGTSIVGIILGGKYDDDAEPDASGAITRPNVRALLTDEDLSGSSASARPKVWLSVKFIPVLYGDTEIASSDPIKELEDFFNRTAGARGIDIVNMSFGRRVTDGSNIMLGEPVRGALIVAAAGNSKEQLSYNGVTANPVSADDRGIMLSVASVDADGQLSHFSNFGKGVTIAAPGCAIKSWLDGETPARPLSGTSMATAVVSFAAALVRARWTVPNNVGISLRNRLLSSARFNPKLVKGGCHARNVNCVQFGSMLDIEAAVLINRDFIEYRNCTGQDDARRCVTRTAIGTLVRSPPFVTGCLSGTLETAKLYGETGLTRNGALKHEDGNSFRLFYEPGAKVGMEEIATEVCASPPGAPTLFEFQPQGLQLDGSMSSADRLSVSTDDLVRVVVRAD